MKIVKNISLCVVALFLLVSIGSCTKENLDLCPATTIVDFSFSYTKNLSGEDKFTTYVKSIDLHIFNSDGLYIKRAKAQGPFASDYLLSVELPSDQTYSFVVWGDMSDSYTENQNNSDKSLSPLVLGESTLTNARLALAHINFEVRKPINILFHGMLKDFHLKGDSRQKAQIDLTNNSNVVHTTVIGLKLPAPALAMNRAQEETSSVGVQYSGQYGRFRFDNTLAPDASLGSYIPYTSELMGSTLETEIALPRIIADRPIDVIVVKNIATRGEEIYKENLIDLLKAIPEMNIRTQDDLDRNDLYRITLDVSGLPQQITITINGWTIIRRIESLD